MLAERVEELPVDRLRFGLSPRREEIDRNHVAALAEVLNQVPPILVQASTMRVIDGVHRVLAARSIGQPTIRAVMFEGDERAAHVEAVHRNVVHGKPLTLAEREAAAARFLELAPEWSDRRIATVSGLSPKTVGRLRKRASGDSAQLRVRVGRDGRARAVDSSDVRRRVVEALEADPEASTREIARRARASQGTVRDVKQRRARGESGLVPGADRRRRSDPEGSKADEGPEAPEGPEASAAGRSGPDAPATTADAGGPPATVVPGDFARWFAARAVEDVEWRRFVEAIPISRVYEVADACRRRGDSWRAFATALEDRARTHRRSGDVDADSDT